jgi:uncharacterized protein (DUF1778 family)
MTDGRKGKSFMPLRAGLVEAACPLNRRYRVCHCHTQRSVIMAKASPAIISVRVSQQERAMLEAAAQAARTNLSDFIRRRAVEAAEEDMLERRQVVIAAEDWERFEAWVHEEPRQVEALGKLAASRPAWER